MKALLMKDVCVLWKQMKIFFLLILVFAATPNLFGNIFAVAYAAIIPYTAIAYDEQSKWDQMALMLPYSLRDIVLSKYMLGWLSVGAAVVASLVIQTAVSLFRHPASGGFNVSLLLLAACGSFCITAVFLPFLFRFGVERGRLVMLLFIALTFGGSSALNAVVTDVYGGSVPIPFGAAIPLLAAAVVLNLASVRLSMRMWRIRNR